MINKAIAFAAEKHKGQKRKYTGEDYIVHPLAVSEIVGEITDDKEMLIAAILHDTLEDTDCTFWELLEEFGYSVACLVSDLTDASNNFNTSGYPELNRVKRKILDRIKLNGVSNRAKTIKLADLIHNTSSIVEHDKKFAKVYMQEKRDLLPCLKGGDSSLYNRANLQIAQYEADQNE